MPNRDPAMSGARLDLARRTRGRCEYGLAGKIFAAVAGVFVSPWFSAAGRDIPFVDNSFKPYFISRFELDRFDQ